MRQTLILIAALALVGCKITVEFPGGGQDKQTKPFTNTLGMKFVPVPGTKVQFCIWETRVKDWAAYAAVNAADITVEANANRKKLNFKQTDTHPVVNVNWDDAKAFCAWLTKKELASGNLKAGQRYRLPTDAEWSSAVGLANELGNTPKEKSRGVKDVYPWGKEWPPPKGAGNYSSGTSGDLFGYTSPVGSFVANAHGLHDLGGNVWEWCEDWYDPARKDYRVLRGMCWRSGVNPVSMLASTRNGNSPPDWQYSTAGFRCVLEGGSGG